VIRDAATVVLMRPSLEIFFLKRAPGHTFMANRWVFPGGRVDERDRDPSLGSHVDDPALLQGTMGALRVTALRETFEESGILLACETGGQPFAQDTSAMRGQVDAGDLGMADVAAALNVCLGLSTLHFFAHWITPDFEPRRYDTRFFLARAPLRQRAGSQSEETTAGVWMTAREALARYDSGELLLAPPTIATLEELSGFVSIEDAIQWAQRARPAPVEPTLVKGATEPTLEMKRGLRMVLRDGRWCTERA
jgi:8-oxo-dGTP pyrophosphatase MutT (NUDIX family)